MILNAIKRTMLTFGAVASIVTGASALSGHASADTLGCSNQVSGIDFGYRYAQKSFAPGQFCLNDISGQHYSIFQSDGNLVTYDRNSNAIWASHTSGLNATRIVFQQDSNVVIYRVDTPLWSTHTNGRGGSDRTVMQQQYDGELNIYAENTDYSEQQIW